MTFLQVVVAGLLIGAVYALFSSGLTLVWGMMNVINFAHGEFVMLGMYVAYWAYNLAHFGVAGFSAAAAVTLFMLGVLVYLVLIKQVMRGPMLAQILSTFGLLLVLRYSAFWAFGADFVNLPEGILGPSINAGGILLSAPKMVAGVAALAITVGMHLLLTRTMLGSRILAVAEDRNAAMLMGIRPDRMQAVAWGPQSGASAGDRGRPDRHFFSDLGDGRRVAGPDRLRGGDFRRLRQRAGGDDRRPDHRPDRSPVGVLRRAGISGRLRLRAVRAGARSGRAA